MRLRLTLPLFLLAATPAAADVPKVATDILPVYGLVARVMDGIGAPDLVVPGAASAHSYDLRPSEAAILDEADIVFWMGEALTPWMVDAVETLAGDAMLVSLLETEGTMLLSFREDDAFGDNHGDNHGDDHGNDHGDDHGDDHDHDHGHDHDGSGIDPHAWLDPANAAFWLGVIAETLAGADLENAAAYRANAEAGQAEIAQALAGVEAHLADAQGIRFMVSHDAYQYFEKRFGLSPIGAITLGDAAAPGPARIARLQQQLSDTGTSCVLIEPQTNQASLGAFGLGAEVKIVEIDPYGIGILDESAFYPAFLASLAESFAACR